MDHFALLPAAERATVFREAAARSRLGSSTIIEKDFWICWTLQKIFSNPTLPGPLFKGGTSLSKVYKVIERFSEDVDIVLDRHALGFTGDQDPPNIAGTNKRNRKLDELAGKCSEIVQSTVHDELKNSFRSVLGEADWKISVDPADADRQSLLFAYPLGLETDLYGLGTYIRPVIRLEFGCRGDVWPSEQQSVQPYIADALPGMLAQPTAEVHVLRPERTFWEKATLLHAVYHSGKMQPRLSRHHYDLACLYRHEYGQLALKDFGLLGSVVEHKKIFFREAAARYDMAKPGSLRVCLRVCPPDVHVAQIRSDYRDMREMFFAEPPPFDTLMGDLRELEDRVNRYPRGKAFTPRYCAKTVSKPHLLGRRELQFEREQLPQVVDIRHFRIELMECLEPEMILRNQQVAGSIPATVAVSSHVGTRSTPSLDYEPRPRHATHVSSCNRVGQGENAAAANQAPLALLEGSPSLEPRNTSCRIRKMKRRSFWRRREQEIRKLTLEKTRVRPLGKFEIKAG